VGAALVANKRKQHAGNGPSNPTGRHTTEPKGGINMQSVLERNDLDELMAMADMADKDFTAEKANVVVISTGTVNPIDLQRASEERAEAQERNRHRMTLPRRPSWDATTTPEQLDTQERSSFVAWRRDLAKLEEEEKLVLTPFEKNIEVWRQLWRVLERSDIVVQVVDGRDPLLYRCEDLEAYCRELNPTKASLLLLNKADLLPEAVRRCWAQYLDQAGIQYAFWSAFAVSEEYDALKSEAAELGIDWLELREEKNRIRRLTRIAASAHMLATLGKEAVDDANKVRILDADEVVCWLEDRAREAAEEAGPVDVDRRLMVGLVGYPNVGKSSTINSLFGAKKTVVGPTPGKTKHFQTLIVSSTLCLCDCPGLVMPKYSAGKPEMVAAGVIPIDRLTEIRAPIEVLATRVGRLQVEEAYGLRLPSPSLVNKALPGTPPTAAQLLHCLALLRGWQVGAGLPDEVRAGRLLLKDYTSGKLLWCSLPPGCQPDSYTPLVHDPETLQQIHTGPRVHSKAGSKAPSAQVKQAAPPSRPKEKVQTPSQQPDEASRHSDDDDDDDDDSSEEDEESDGEVTLTQAQTEEAQRIGLSLHDLTEADLDLLGGLGDSAATARAKAEKRAEFKFQRKSARSKGDRGQGKADGVYDGAAMTTGKKGGLVRVGGYC